MKKLEPVLDAQFRKAQSEITRVLNAEDRLKRQLQDLQDARRRQDETRDGSDPASVAGADVRWQRWIDQRRTEINLELASLAAERSRLRTKLKAAFGRKEALTAVLRTQHEENKILEKRRRNQLS